MSIHTHVYPLRVITDADLIDYAVVIEAVGCTREEWDALTIGDRAYFVWEWFIGLD